ncbi:unnamed protein product [Gadus morhua 'NCC']
MGAASWLWRSEAPLAAVCSRASEPRSLQRDDGWLAMPQACNVWFSNSGALLQSTAGSSSMESYTSSGPSPVDPLQVDPLQVDPLQVDPLQVDPLLVDPLQVDPLQRMPGQTQPGQGQKDYSFY